ncbi:MAG: DUF1145 domain-containing protein [Pseudomonadales bacterium]|nr:DUF1145 domain-containing protein [Pseudomonadales bacterium]
MINIAKIATVIGWFIIFANWIMPFGGQIGTIIHYSGLGLLAAHAIETAVFLPKAKQLGGNTLAHAAQLFVFGYPHNMAIEAELAQKS